MSEFRDKTIRGVSWSVVSQVGKVIPLAVVSIVLANLLSPRAFGLIAMITIIVGFAEVFAEMGFSAALVQRRGLQKEHLSSVFWLNLASGGLLTALFMAGAPLLGSFYGEPLLVPLTMFIAVTFLIKSAAVVQRALFTREVDFKALSIVEVSSVGVAGVVAIWMAYSGYGVWSLAVQSVLQALLSTALLWTFSSWRPHFQFAWQGVKDLLGFSLSYTGTQSMNYWARQADDLLIGKFIGSAALGVYRFAYDIMLFPLQNISRVMSRVMFPSLSSIQSEKERVKDVFLKMAGTVALVTFPLMLGLLATTERFVYVVFGAKWAGMIPILRVFALLGLSQSIGTLVGNLFLSQGRADLQFRLGLVSKPLTLIAIVIGLQWGVLGVALGYAAASWLMSYPIFYFAGRLVNLTYGELLRTLGGTFGCAVLMAGAVYGLGWILPASWPGWLQLTVQVASGAALYWLLIHSFGLKTYRYARTLLAEQLSVS